MSQAFILIPGARLPADAAAGVLASLAPAEADALAQIGLGCGEAHAQRLGTAAFARAPHLVWLWSVLTRRALPPREAPWRWLALGARELAPEMWALEPYRLDAEGRAAPEAPALTDEDFFALTAAIEPVFAKRGFRFQIWDTKWFLTRAEDWPAVCEPRMAATGKKPAQFVIEGEAAEDTREMLAEADAALRARPEAARLGIAGLWLWGGGHEMLFFPPTLVRSVACDDPAVIGWANAAGILRQYLGPDAGRWPEAPEGDAVAVVGDLYPAWLAGDWARWKAALPGAAAKVASYRAAAEARNSEAFVPVLFGLGGAATLAPAKSTLASRLFGHRRKASLPASAWCPDLYDEGNSPA